MRKLITVPRRPDMTEVLHLVLEALNKWMTDASSTEDLNMAAIELNDCSVGFKSIEKSSAKENAVVIFMDDGTSYRVSINRIDNCFK